MTAESKKVLAERIAEYILTHQNKASLSGTNEHYLPTIIRRMNLLSDFREEFGSYTVLAGYITPALENLQNRAHTRANGSIMYFPTPNNNKDT